MIQITNHIGTYINKYRTQTNLIKPKSNDTKETIEKQTQNMNLTQLRCVVVETNTETGVNMGQISPEMGIEKQRRDLIWRSKCL